MIHDIILFDASFAGHTNHQQILGESQLYFRQCIFLRVCPAVLKAHQGKTAHRHGLRTPHMIYIYPFAVCYEPMVKESETVCLKQWCATFFYCRPCYFYLYEVRPPVSSNYIYEIRLIEEYWFYLVFMLNTFKHKLRIHSITLCDITIPNGTHRVDWFFCFVFVLLQYRLCQHGRQILYFKWTAAKFIVCRRPHVVHRWLNAWRKIFCWSHVIRSCGNTTPVISEFLVCSGAIPLCCDI